MIAEVLARRLLSSSWDGIGGWSMFLGILIVVKHLPARSCSCFRINDQTETTKNNILKDDLVSVFQIFLYNNL